MQLAGSLGVASGHCAIRHAVHCESAGEPSQKLLPQVLPEHRDWVQ